MKNKKMIGLLLTVMIVVALGYGYVRFRSGHEPSALADAVIVKAITVTEQAMPIEVKAIGTLVAPRSVEITPEISGHVKNVLFEDGQAVAAGAPLIQFDDAVYAAQYQSAKARWEFSESDYKRKQFLIKQGAISQQAIDQAQAERKERKASVDEAKVMLTKMRLDAPFAGVVSKSKVSVGDYVTNGSSIVTLTDLQQLRIEYDVPEQNLPQVLLGQAVEVTTSTYPGQRFVAKVSYVSPTVNIRNRSISLYATLTNQDHRLKPGMFVNISHRLNQQDKQIMVPARCLVPMLDGEQVYKIIDHKAIPVTVTVGKHINDQVQILGGLVAGDVVVTDGQLKLHNGRSVQIES